MSAEKLAEALLDGLNKWLASEVPLRVPDHSRLNKRVEEIVAQVRTQAAREAYDAAIEDALSEVQRHQNESARTLSVRIKAHAWSAPLASTPTEEA